MTRAIQKLPEMLEQRVVTRSVFEFETQDDGQPPGLVRLRITVEPSCLTVHDVWDGKAKDVQVSWFQLHQLGRLVAEWDASVEDIRLNRETIHGMLRELRCELGGVRGVPSACARPPCGGEPLFTGAPTGLGLRCAPSPLEWPMAGGAT